MSLLSLLPFVMLTIEQEDDASHQAAMLEYAIQNKDMVYIDLLLDHTVYIEPRFVQLAQETGDGSVISRIRRHLFCQSLNAPVRIT